jgi:hypothetical protein
MTGPHCGPSAVAATVSDHDPLPPRPAHHYARNNIRNILSLASILSHRRSLGRKGLDGRSLDGRSLDGRSLDGRSLDGRSLGS